MFCDMEMFMLLGNLCLFFLQKNSFRQRKLRQIHKKYTKAKFSQFEITKISVFLSNQYIWRQVSLISIITFSKLVLYRLNGEIVLIDSMWQIVDSILVQVKPLTIFICCFYKFEVLRHKNRLILSQDNFTQQRNTQLPMDCCFSDLALLRSN